MGESTVDGHLRRNNLQAIARIEFISRACPSFELIVFSPLWRYLDPEAVTLAELARDQHELLLRRLGALPQQADKRSAPDERDIDALLTYAEAGGDCHWAMCVLWKWLRSCVLVSDIHKYVHLYQTWSSMRATLMNDPVFSAVTPPLYEHSRASFGRLVILNSKDARSEDAHRRS